jgi:hypothetical protein
VTHELVGGMADDDLVWARTLLQAVGDVEGGAMGGGPPASVRMAHDDLAGVERGAQGDPHAESSVQLLVEIGQGRVQLERRPGRSQGVVVVQRRDAEVGDHRVAALIRDTVVERDHPLRPRAEPPLDLVAGLPVQLLAEIRPTDDVAEEDGDRPAGQGKPRERATTVCAGPCVGRARMAAIHADRHDQSVRTELFQRNSVNALPGESWTIAVCGAMVCRRRRMLCWPPRSALA